MLMIISGTGRSLFVRGAVITRHNVKIAIRHLAPIRADIRNHHRVATSVHPHIQVSADPLDCLLSIHGSDPAQPKAHKRVALTTQESPYPVNLPDPDHVPGKGG